MNAYLQKALSWGMVFLALLALWQVLGRSLLFRAPAIKTAIVAPSSWPALFGVTENASNKTSAAQPVDLKLVGTVVTQKNQQAALIQSQGKTWLLHVGERRSQPDISLLALTPSWADVQLGSQKQRLHLARAEDKVKAVSPAAEKPVMTGSLCEAKADPSARAISYSLLSAFAQNPNNLANLFQVQNQQLLVKNSSGLGAVLDVQDGDQLLTVNGLGITNLAMMSALVINPLITGQTVTVEGSRAGVARTWRYICQR
jgi:hypothetical protein